MISSFCLVFRSPPFPKLDFGLCARVFSAVFTHLEPTILFSHSPAVSLSKPRDFRLYEPTILFYPLVSGFPHRKFLWSRDRSRPIRSLHLGQTGPLYYCPPFRGTIVTKRSLLKILKMPTCFNEHNIFPSY